MREAAAFFLGDHDFRNFCKVRVWKTPCTASLCMLLLTLVLPPSAASGAVAYRPLRLNTLCRSLCRACCPPPDLPHCSPPLPPQVDVAQVTNFRRRVLDFTLEPLPGCAWGGRRLLQLNIRGTAFLWHQVGGAGEGGWQGHG